MLTTLVIFSCTKQAGKQTGSVVPTANIIAKDAAFMALNGAVDRLDPQYLRLVYKEKRSIEQLTKQSNDLLLQLKADPENPVFQQQLADFYHFRDIGQMKDCSATIASALQELDKKYGLGQSVSSADKARVFYDARRMVAGARMAAGQPVKQVNGLWSDFVDANCSDFGYNSYVYDEGFEGAGESGGDGCNEPCCYQLATCKSTARSTFITNLVKYAGGGIVTVGGVGAASGSVVPFWGNLVGAVVGGAWGGAAGSIIAANIYNNDLNICSNNYQACLIQKK